MPSGPEQLSMNDPRIGLAAERTLLAYLFLPTP